jgi:integrase
MRYGASQQNWLPMAEMGQLRRGLNSHRQLFTKTCRVINGFTGTSASWSVSQARRQIMEQDQVPVSQKPSRDLVLFNLAIDSKLRGCDVVAVQVDDVAPSGYAMDRATIRQKKTGRPVRFELTDQTRQAIDEYLRLTGRKPGQFLFAGRGDGSRGLTTRQYARLVQEWVASIGLDPAKFGTHSLRRTKAVLIYRRTGNLRAVQLLLGHSKIESTVRYLGIEVDDAIEIAEKIDL